MIYNKDEFEEILKLLDFDILEYEEFLQEHYSNGNNHLRNLNDFFRWLDE